jgi:hypothetical protein
MGESRHVSLVPLSVTNFRVADHTPGAIRHHTREVGHLVKVPSGTVCSAIIKQ